MSYQQIPNRNTTDSRESFRSSFRPSIETRDSCSTFGQQTMIDKVCIKLNELDTKNAMIKQQLMNLAKICKDTKGDVDKIKEEITQKKVMSSKQKKSRRSNAEKREERHRAVR